MAKLEFKYEEAMQEEGIELNDLPKFIRLKINAIKPNLSRYERNPSDAMREALVKQDVEVANDIYDWIEEQEKIEEERMKAEEEKKRKAEEAEAAKKKAAEEAEAAKKKAAEEAEAAKKKAAEEAEAAKAKAAEEAEAAKAKAAEEAEAKRKEEEESAAAKKKEEEEAEAAKKKAEEEENKNKEQKYKFGTPEMAKEIKEKIEAGGGNISIKDLESIIKKTAQYPHQEVYNIKLHKPYMKSYYVIV